MAQPPGAWHLEDIKAAIRKRFGSLREASRAWGYDIAAISHVLMDPRYSRPLEQKIASELGVKPHVLWPTRWSLDGNPLPRDGDQGDITDAQRLSCPKRKAA